MQQGSALPYRAYPNLRPHDMAPQPQCFAFWTLLHRCSPALWPQLNLGVVAAAAAAAAAASMKKQQLQQ